MQMDNLCYSREERLLVANELKLGGKKNPDQILKYGSMFGKLKEEGFIGPQDRMGLLFIGDRHEPSDWNAEIEAEIAYCEKQPKCAHLLQDSVVAAARAATCASTTWKELADLCDTYAVSLGDEAQVERKLLRGFSTSLLEKKGVRTEAGN